MTDATDAVATPSLLDAYRSVRAATERLCAPMSAEDQTVQAMADASPAKWHRAHTTWFFETLVLEAGVPGYRPFDGLFRVLFNSYYNSVGAQHPRAERGLVTRPGVAETTAYRAHVDAAMERLLAAGVDEHLATVVEVGLHHEQQHQELIATDFKYLLSRNPLEPTYVPRPARAERTAPDLTWLGHDGGIVEIGHEGAGFAYDNETPRHRTLLEPFRLASRPVTNREYLEFIADGGYRTAGLWLSDGWATVQQEGWEAPLYWRHDDADGWTTFTSWGRVPVAPDEPVLHVSLYEADAYARWAGARLPSEAEWEVVAEGAAADGTFQEEGGLHPHVAPDGPQGAPVQMLGDVWEWTRSPYSAYPGYAPPEGALGEYNSKFMCNQMVLRGGSCATPADHIRASYRNFFPAGARWQFMGFRLAKDGRG
ncbi:MAG: ergothioneine biosynthesis protein EgtB [Longimicrobiales bacterium]